MGRTITKWRLQSLVQTIVATLLNKYDFFMVIEGNTGTGKSTLAFHIASGVAKEFRRLYALKEKHIEYYYERVGRKMGFTEEEFVLKILKLKEERKYRFKPVEALIYTQDAMQKALSGWQGISIPDELVNVAFNRDFYSEKQKDIIKMLNMFRDHENLTICCVPSFQVIDNQIKNLTKMKITVKKRGVAIIHTPNSTVYCKDKWDQLTNEKIERAWITKKITNPNYSKLTTFRGLIRFYPLTKQQEKMYQDIKNDKRAVVLRDDMGMGSKEDDKKSDPFNNFMELLEAGSIRSGQVLEGYARAMGLTENQLIARLKTQLKKKNKPHILSQYYWDKKAKKEAEFNGL